MDQAYAYFNAGKYKQALNLLNSNNLNVDSYQPNLAVSEYLANRSNQSALNCLRRLNQILIKKPPSEEESIELRSEQIIKYNLAIILIILGKKDNAVTLMHQIYSQRQCFIEYVQCRILLLLMQLQIGVKNYTTPLVLLQGFPNKPMMSKSQVNQWVSIILHEHSKSSGIVSEQFYFMTEILIVQSLIGLGVGQSSLPQPESLEEKKQGLIERFRKRKSTINKYYEVNIIMMDRFLMAQRCFHMGNITQTLAFLNLNNLQDQYQNVTISKLSLNIYNSLFISNVGVVHFHINKNSLALHFFKKARQHLLKAFTADDRQLNLIAANYNNNSERISENIALAFLDLNPQQAHLAYESICKSNKGKVNYKFWYRVGQAALSYYHSLQGDKKQKYTNLLQCAYTAFSNAELCLKNCKIPPLRLMKYYKSIKQEDLKQVIIKTQQQISKFQTSIMVLIAYTSLALGAYYRTIQVAKKIRSLKNQDQAKFYADCYLIEAYIKVGRISDAKLILIESQKDFKTHNHHGLPINVVAQNYHQGLIAYPKEVILIYQMCMIHIKQNQIYQAYTMIAALAQQRLPLKFPKPLQLLMHYLTIRIKDGIKFNT